jgi:hypothetical protein
MAAEARFTVTVVGSFALWFPALGAMLRGELDVGAAGVRYAFALALAWVVVSVLDRTMGRYAEPVPADDGPAMDGGGHEPIDRPSDQRRRATDASQSDDAATEA